MYMPSGSWKNECIVTPPALMAATPVGATTTVFLAVVRCICLRKVVLPVPALPVRKRWRPVWLMTRVARENSALGWDMCSHSNFGIADYADAQILRRSACIFVMGNKSSRRTMIKSASLIMCVLLAQLSFAQTHRYEPLNLDTTSFWVLAYDYYDGDFGGSGCRAELVSYVSGDSTIGTRRYSKVLTYVSEIGYNNHPSCWMGKSGEASLSLIYEDTAAKKVYNLRGDVIAEFNRNVGDSILVGSRLAVIDSVTSDSIGGMVRRTQWARFARVQASINYRLIEGIGASRNFPFAGYGEWGIPVYTLKCYSKGGKTLYTDDRSSTCIKRPPARVSVKNTPRLKRAAFVVQERQFRIADTRLLPVTVQVIDMAGRLLQSHLASNPQSSLLNVSTGTYIVRLIKQDETAAFRIFID